MAKMTTHLALTCVVLKKTGVSINAAQAIRQISICCGRKLCRIICLYLAASEIVHYLLEITKFISNRITLTSQIQSETAANWLQKI